jgi:hypothetical protein
MKEREQLIESILNSDLHGKRIYILGSAEFGATNEPKLIRSTAGAYNAFGRSGTLIEAFHKIKYTSKDNYIYLVKVTGEHANAYLNVNCAGGGITQEGFVLCSKESNEIYNDIRIVIDMQYLSVQYPEGLGGATKIYYYTDHPTIEKLTTAINNDANKTKAGKVYAYYNVDPSTKTDTAFYACNPSEVYMYGGQCGLNYSKNLLYNYLDRAYGILESHDIDIIVPVDAFMDDIYPNDMYANESQYGQKYYQPNKDYLTEHINERPLSFFNQLIEFCLIQMNFGVVTHGIIGFNPSYETWSDYYNQSNEIKQMYKACFDYNMECSLNPFYAFLVSVVGGDLLYNKGTMIDNAYLAYAALCAQTVITSGTTNIPFSDSINLYHELEDEHLAELADKGIVMFRHSPLYDKPVVYDGVTASPEQKELKVFCNIRMIQMAISYLNKLFQFYIGQDMTELIEKNVITSDANKLFKVLIERGVITKYNFSLVPYYNQHEIKVYLNLETSYMIKSVTICSAINVEFAENEV